MLAWTPHQQEHLYERRLKPTQCSTIQCWLFHHQTTDGDSDLGFPAATKERGICRLFLFPSPGDAGTAVFFRQQGTKQLQPRQGSGTASVAGPCHDPEPITAQSPSLAGVLSLAPSRGGPEEPQEMVAAFHIHVLWWETSPWSLLWRLLSTQGSDGQQPQPGLAEEGVRWPRVPIALPMGHALSL